MLRTISRRLGFVCFVLLALSVTSPALAKDTPLAQRGPRIHVTRDVERWAERTLHKLPLEEKVKVADYVIDTSGTKENTMEQTRAVYGSLRGLLA